MKSLIAGLLLAVPMFANAYTWTASDSNLPVWVTTKDPYEHTFDITKGGADPFQPNVDTITSYNVKVNLYDPTYTGWFFLDFDTAVLNQPGILGDGISVFTVNGELNGWSIQGMAALNAFGKLDITVSSLLGSFYVTDATLVAKGDNKTAVPEPTSVALLAAGLIGIAVMRRKGKAS
jgi:hypothetical protein